MAIKAITHSKRPAEFNLESIVFNFQKNHKNHFTQLKAAKSFSKFLGIWAPGDQEVFE